MKNILYGILAGALLVSCSKQDTNSELQKAAAAMAQPDSTQPTAAPAAVPQSASAAAPVTESQAQAQEMKQAMVAYKAGEMEDAVVRLQKLRATPVMSPEKRIAVNDAIAAVMGEIHARAQQGDARAIQALKTYEKMQTLPR